VEQSKYNFEIADTEVLFKQFDEAEAMNERLID
jgi:glycyl-tRNA synthetase alpha chain